MRKEEMQVGVLAVSLSPEKADLLRRALQGTRFFPLALVPSYQDARLYLTHHDVSIILLNTCKPEPSGVLPAIDLLAVDSAGFLILADTPPPEAVCAALSGRARVLTTVWPDDPAILLQAVRRLYRAMEPAVEQAKQVLIGSFGMTEEQAHRYLQKTAMDLCVKRRVLAESILREHASEAQRSVKEGKSA